MMELIKVVFPLELYLHIFQLEEYKPRRFLNWVFNNFFIRKIHVKKPLIFTRKVKNIILIYFLLCLFALFVNVFLFLLLLIQPYIGFVIAIFILKPYEIWNRKKIIEKTRNKISYFRNLKIIAITGSFGKTSTKEILYQILKTKYKVLRTPESFNTVFGIAKVVDLELDNSYDFFICEMAAYKIGEIKELCYMIPPTFGILTGITTQHFERFGSLPNTIKAKFELVDAIKKRENIVVNTEDLNITQNLKFKISNENIKTTNIKFNRNGSEFDLIIKGKTYSIKTPLFGMANIKNITLAAEMALKLDVRENELVKAIKNLTPIDNRMVLANYGKTIVINNTYSSNMQSFKEMIETAKYIKGKKVLVTPGIVELGNLETEIHENLGRLSQNVFDKIILVGENNRTKSFARGLDQVHEFIEDSRKEYFETIEKLKRKYDWIFLENDVTENY